MDTKPRPRYPTPAAWAAAKAEAIRAQAAALPTHPSSQWRKVRARMEAIARFNSQAAHFDHLAARYRARGL